MGRLDRPTEGLLLLTNDGDAANGLLHPGREVEREYSVVVAGVMDEAAVNRLRRGVELDDGPARPKSVRVVERGELDTTLALVLTEGRKREVRRMLLAVNFGVQRLVRTRFGRVRLERLASGEWRKLSAFEIESLLDLSSLK